MATALLAGILTLIAVNLRRLTALSASMNAGANASVLPVLNTASMVGFGAVIAAVPAFELVSAASCRSTLIALVAIISIGLSFGSF